MKKFLIYSAVFLVMVINSPVWSQETQLSDSRAKIEVNGEAVLSVKPDRVVINFGIETFDNDIGDAKNKNNKILKKAFAVMKEDLGIQENEVQADRVSIEPKWKKDKDREELAGYVARDMFVVNLNDAEKAEDVIFKLLDEGVNCIYGISFQSAELKKYQEQARELALKTAREKAEKMAVVLGLAIGDAVKITENATEPSWYYYSSWWHWGTGQYQEMSKNIPQGIKNTKCEMVDVFKLGQITVYSNVDVTFLLKKEGKEINETPAPQETNK
ncbi:MAG: SIMPL domain-containing protein [bacterium]